MTSMEKETLLNKLKLFKAIDKMPVGTRFKARDIGVHGSTIAHNMKGFKVVDHEDYWYKIDDDTMKKGKINIYERTDVDLHKLPRWGNETYDIFEYILGDFKMAVQFAEWHVESAKLALKEALTEYENILHEFGDTI